MGDYELKNRCACYLAPRWRCRSVGAVYTSMCVHEHLHTGPMCPMHIREAETSVVVCSACYDDGHECRIILEPAYAQ